MYGRGLIFSSFLLEFSTVHDIGTKEPTLSVFTAVLLDVQPMVTQWSWIAKFLFFFFLGRNQYSHVASYVLQYAITTSL